MSQFDRDWSLEKLELTQERDRLRAVCNELMFCCDNDAGTYDPHDIGKIVAMARTALAMGEKETTPAPLVTLRFSSPEARNRFMAGLADGWGENACSLEGVDGGSSFDVFVFGVDSEEEEETTQPLDTPWPAVYSETLGVPSGEDL